MAAFGAHPTGRWRRISRPRLLASGVLLIVILGVLSLLVRPAGPRLRTIAHDWINRHTNLTETTPSDVKRYLARHALPPGSRLPPSSVLGNGPLRVHASNPRYFADGRGRTVYLTGSHTWLNLQDGGLWDPPPRFDFGTYLEFLEAHGHNFFRLWTWEQTKWVVEWGSPYFFSPHAFRRTGPGLASDGKPKFDLDTLNDDYFHRVRQRVEQAGRRGFYVSIMLFNGWSNEHPKGHAVPANPWSGHPFNHHNNINGLDGDPNRDNSGEETHSLALAAVLDVQKKYVTRVIDAVNDLDNVLYEISNESHGGSQDWQYEMIRFVRDYESGKPKRHPVGMTVEWPGGDNADVFESPADWVSPREFFDPPVSDGRKVIIADTDHIWGIGGDRQWVWKCFTRGLNPVFMDQYDDGYKLDGGGYRFDNPTDVSLRQNMGYTRWYAARVDLAAMHPRPDLCSTSYCLASASAGEPEYLVYLPQGGSVTVTLQDTSRAFAIEWFNPATGVVTSASVVELARLQRFTAPFDGDAVLYLRSQPPPPHTTTAPP